MPSKPLVLPVPHWHLRSWSKQPLKRLWIQRNAFRVPPSPPSISQQQEEQGKQLNACIDDQATGIQRAEGGRKATLGANKMQIRFSTWNSEPSSAMKDMSVHLVSTAHRLTCCYWCCNSKVDPKNTHTCMSATPNSRRGKNKSTKIKILWITLIPPFLGKEEEGNFET